MIWINNIENVVKMLSIFLNNIINDLISSRFVMSYKISWMKYYSLFSCIHDIFLLFFWFTLYMYLLLFFTGFLLEGGCFVCLQIYLQIYSVKLKNKVMLLCLRFWILYLNMVVLILAFLNDLVLKNIFLFQMQTSNGL